MTTATKDDFAAARKQAIKDYRNSRTEWLLVAWALAGGAIGSALVFISANSVFLNALLK